MDHWTYRESQSYHEIEWKGPDCKVFIEVTKESHNVNYYCLFNSSRERVSGLEFNLPVEAALEMTAWLTEGLYHGNYGS